MTRRESVYQKELYLSEKFNITINQFDVSGELVLPKEGRRLPLIIYVWGSGPTNYKTTIENSQLFREFLECGYAVLLYDKPGSGLSTGEFSPNKLITERTLIARKAIEKVSQHNFIDPEKIGLFGSSQAGYIIPTIIKTTNKVSFAISWSSPMENGIYQSAYQVKEFLRCKGYDVPEASTAEHMYIDRELAKTYKAYLPPAKYLNSIEAVRVELGWGDILNESSFRTLAPNSDDLIDPMELLHDIEIPYLALYGENDKNINPYQAMDAFNHIKNKTATL